MLVTIHAFAIWTIFFIVVRRAPSAKCKRGGKSICASEKRMKFHDMLLVLLMSLCKGMYMPPGPLKYGPCLYHFAKKRYYMGLCVM